jgi:hypothetical protein
MPRLRGARKKDPLVKDERVPRGTTLLPRLPAGGPKQRGLFAVTGAPGET